MRSLVLSFVLVMVSVPATAAAATVDVDQCDWKCESAVNVTAEPGELNRIRVTVTGFTTEVSDAGAPLRAGTGCSAVDPNTVRCRSNGKVRVAAGDGDDSVEVAGDAGNGDGYASLRGGPGDDLLIGAGGDDWINGDTGADRLLGGGGDDLLSDDDATGDADGDVVNGGPGVDVVVYAGRTAPVTVRLGRLGRDDRAGEAGENDRLVAVEGAGGGDADDFLRAGDAGASPSTSHEIISETPGLSGGRGDDVLIGGRGDDTIDASQGADRVRGGAGEDEVTLAYATRRRGTRVDCGAGGDDVFNAAPSDRLDRNCDFIATSGEPGATFEPAPAASGGIRLLARDAQTRVSVVAAGGRLDGRLIARRPFPSSRSYRAGRLHLTALGRRLARRGELPAIHVRVRAGARGPRFGFQLSA